MTQRQHAPITELVSSDSHGTEVLRTKLSAPLSCRHCGRNDAEFAYARKEATDVVAVPEGAYCSILCRDRAHRHRHSTRAA